jgi:hypothetical protein
MKVPIGQAEDQAHAASIGASDSFFRLGGDLIAAMHVSPAGCLPSNYFARPAFFATKQSSTLL